MLSEGAIRRFDSLRFGKYYGIPPSIQKLKLERASRACKYQARAPHGYLSLGLVIVGVVKFLGKALWATVLLRL